MLLDSIKTPVELRKLTLGQLKILSPEIREVIIDTISKNGGHLASSLGVVELTLALHYVFNTPEDKIIWDVGHQTYAHKIITGRKDCFSTIRKYKGISGFPKCDESEYDPYNVGHSSTSLSLAIGEAVSRDLKKGSNKVVAVIGDGSLTGGMAFEALNQIGHQDNDIIIILNDNEHSISKNVGGLSQYLTSIITDPMYNRFRYTSVKIMKGIPRIGQHIYNFVYRAMAAFKGFIVPGQLFEDMGIRYFGPVDGNDLRQLRDVLTRVKNISTGPKIIHVITKKGKGYPPAEKDPARFHGIGPFDKETGKVAKSGTLSYSEVAGKTLAHLAKKDKKILAITAAMKLGTGLYEFEKLAPDRFFDVGIAEQHGITFAGSLAQTGLKPFISIYSTFIQRATDQLIHDLGIMNMPVKILIDRSGIVGDDGETHHGLFDIAIIKNIPNFIFFAPANGEELRDIIVFAAQYSKGPVAVRFPRGRIQSKTLDIKAAKPIIPGKAKVLKRGTDIAILALGDMVAPALEVQKEMKKQGISVTVVNLLCIKPLDIKTVTKVVTDCKRFITLENGIISGGLGESILSALDSKLRSRLIFQGGFPDEFITQGSTQELFAEYGLDPASLVSRIKSALK